MGAVAWVQILWENRILPLPKGSFESRRLAARPKPPLTPLREHTVPLVVQISNRLSFKPTWLTLKLLNGVAGMWWVAELQHCRVYRVKENIQTTGRVRTSKSHQGRGGSSAGSFVPKLLPGSI